MTAERSEGERQRKASQMERGTNCAGLLCLKHQSQETGCRSSFVKVVCMCYLTLLLQIIQIALQLVDLLRIDGRFLWALLQLGFELRNSRLQPNRHTR